MGRRKGTGGAAVLATAALLTGCGGGGSSSDLNSALARAMESVGAGDSSRAAFSFTDVARLRDLGLVGGGNRIDPRSSRALVGLGPLVDAPQGVLGLDPLAADTAISIGKPPHEAIRLDGQPTDSVAKQLGRLGAKRSDWPSGGTLYSTGGEGTVQARGPLARLGILGLGDRIALDGGTVTMSPYEADLATADGDGAPLADELPQKTAWACLGDPIAAETVSGKDVGVPQASLVAIGITAPLRGNDPVEEVLCAVDPSAAAADAQATNLKKAFDPKRIDPLTGNLMGDAVARAAFHRGRSGNLETARAAITLRPGTSPGYLFAALGNGGVTGFLTGGGRPIVN